MRFGQWLRLVNIQDNIKARVAKQVVTVAHLVNILVLDGLDATVAHRGNIKTTHAKAVAKDVHPVSIKGAPGRLAVRAVQQVCFAAACVSHKLSIGTQYVGGIAHDTDTLISFWIFYV